MTCRPPRPTFFPYTTLFRSEQVLGVAREKHHRHLINESGTRGVIFYTEDDCVGYAYISPEGHIGPLGVAEPKILGAAFKRSEEHTSELQSHSDLVCRLLLEK